MDTQNQTPAPTTPQTPEQPAATSNVAGATADQPTQTPPAASNPTAPLAAEPITPAASQQTPAQPTDQSATPPQSGTPDAHHPSKKTFIMIGVLVVTLLLAGGAMFVMNVNSKTQRLGAQKTNPKKAPVPTATPILSEEEMEIEAIDTGDPTTDLQELEKDVNTLQ